MFCLVILTSFISAGSIARVWRFWKMKSALCGLPQSLWFSIRDFQRLRTYLDINRGPAQVLSIHMHRVLAAAFQDRDFFALVVLDAHYLVEPAELHGNQVIGQAEDVFVLENAIILLYISMF